MAEEFTILARTPFPGPDAPAGNVRRVAVTFRLSGEVTAHTIWIPEELATEELIDTAIRRWIEIHPSI